MTKLRTARALECRTRRFSEQHDGATYTLSPTVQHGVQDLEDGGKTRIVWETVADATGRINNLNQMDILGGAWDESHDLDLECRTW